MKDSIFESLVSVTNDRESSAILVSKLLNIYDPVKRVFQLNNNICLSFCKKEVAKVLGMNDSGISFADYEKTCPKSPEFPEHLNVLKEKFAADANTTNQITLSNIKDILKNMTVDDEDSKVQFKQLMTYFLIEGMLRCGPNSSRIPRCKMWGLVTNLEECWKVNWAEEIDNHLHFSLRTCKEQLKSKPDKEHTFMGATPVLEAIIYERIPKLRPGTCSEISPLIQKYESTRKEVDNVLRDLEANDIEVCSHCTLPLENTLDSHSPLAAKNSPRSVSLGDQFGGLSLSCGGGDVGTSDSLSGPSTNLSFGDASVGESGELVHQGLPNVVDRSEELVLYDDAEVERLNLKCEKRELVKKASPPSDSVAEEVYSPLMETIPSTTGTSKLGKDATRKRKLECLDGSRNIVQPVRRCRGVKKHKKKSLSTDDPPMPTNIVIEVSSDDDNEELIDLKGKRWELLENVSATPDSVSFDNGNESFVDLTQEELVEKLAHSAPPPGDIICVQGYSVKQSNAPILEVIFNKHGNIAADCFLREASVRAIFLEAICEVARLIETSDVTTIISKMEEIEFQVSEADAVNIDVSWLQAQLKDIHTRNEALEKTNSLMEMKVNTILVKRAARTDLIERCEELVAAQKRCVKAEECIKVLDLAKDKPISTIIAKRAARADLRERCRELVVAQEQFAKAERCMKVLDLVEEKLSNKILESKAENTLG